MWFGFSSGFVEGVPVSFLLYFLENKVIEKTGNEFNLATNLTLGNIR